MPCPRRLILGSASPALTRFADAPSPTLSRMDLAAWFSRILSAIASLAWSLHLLGQLADGVAHGLDGVFSLPLFAASSAFPTSEIAGPTLAKSSSLLMPILPMKSRASSGSAPMTLSEMACFELSGRLVYASPMEVRALPRLGWVLSKSLARVDELGKRISSLGQVFGLAQADLVEDSLGGGVLDDFPGDRQLGLVLELVRQFADGVAHGLGRVLEASGPGLVHRLAHVAHGGAELGQVVELADAHLPGWSAHALGSAPMTLSETACLALSAACRTPHRGR